MTAALPSTRLRARSGSRSAKDFDSLGRNTTQGIFPRSSDTDGLRLDVGQDARLTKDITLASAMAVPRVCGATETPLGGQCGTLAGDKIFATSVRTGPTIPSTWIPEDSLGAAARVVDRECSWPTRGRQGIAFKLSDESRFLGLPHHAWGRFELWVALPARRQPAGGADNTIVTATRRSAPPTTGRLTALTARRTQRRNITTPLRASDGHTVTRQRSGSLWRRPRDGTGVFLFAFVQPFRRLPRLQRGLQHHCRRRQRSAHRPLLGRHDDVRRGLGRQQGLRLRPCHEGATTPPRTSPWPAATPSPRACGAMTTRCGSWRTTSPGRTTSSPTTAPTAPRTPTSTSRPWTPRWTALPSTPTRGASGPTGRRCSWWTTRTPRSTPGRCRTKPATPPRRSPWTATTPTPRACGSTAASCG